jgi:hypothetical protein
LARRNFAVWTSSFVNIIVRNFHRDRDGASIARDYYAVSAADTFTICATFAFENQPSRILRRVGDF